MDISRTTAGAELLSCDLDASCAVMDCAAMLEDFGEALTETPEGAEIVAYYCGLAYVDKLNDLSPPLGEAVKYF